MSAARQRLPKTAKNWQNPVDRASAVTTRCHHMATIVHSGRISVERWQNVGGRRAVTVRKLSTLGFSQETPLSARTCQHELRHTTKAVFVVASTTTMATMVAVLDRPSRNGRDRTMAGDTAPENAHSGEGQSSVGTAHALRAAPGVSLSFLSAPTVFLLAANCSFARPFAHALARPHTALFLAFARLCASHRDYGSSSHSFAFWPFFCIV